MNWRDYITSDPTIMFGIMDVIMKQGNELINSFSVLSNEQLRISLAK